jgi:tetratricopeptide (TPR) repeat protein
MKSSDMAVEKSSALYQKGREAMAANDLDSAVRLFRSSAQAAPHFKTLELLGECFLKRDQNREAIIPLAAAVGLGNKPYRALYLLAQALDRSGHRDEAIEKLTLALQIKADYKNARTLLDSFQAGTL